MSRRRRIIAALSSLAALALIAVGLTAPAANATTIAHAAAAPASVATTGFRFVDIPGSGVVLKGKDGKTLTLPPVPGLK